ncbi:MAG TPA: hypothetical protein VMH35_05100 [Streptosporangiaceae bacterium]|nr:hypothetical protein [Streptosporangiaceae bacterium]
MTQNEPEPAELGTTGDPQVDQALDPLADLGGLPLHEHPAVFEQVHGALAGALGTLDAGPPGPGSPGPAAAGPAAAPGS